MTDVELPSRYKEQILFLHRNVIYISLNNFHFEKSLFVLLKTVHKKKLFNVPFCQRRTQGGGFRGGVNNMSWEVGVPRGWVQKYHK